MPITSTIPSSTAYEEITQLTISRGLAGTTIQVTVNKWVTKASHDAGDSPMSTKHFGSPTIAFTAAQEKAIVNAILTQLGVLPDYTGATVQTI